MKKIYTYILSTLAAAAALVSCDLASFNDSGSFLDQSSPSTFDDATVFSNYTLAEQAIFSISMSMVEQNSYRGRYLPYYGYNTDIEWWNDLKANNTKSDILSYNMQSNNSEFDNEKNPYSDIYSGIERANLAIDGLRKYGNTASDAQMAYLLGEALTMRAMLYYDLIKAWGDVPARFEPVSSATMYLPKSDRDVIFKQILADLEESFDYLVYPGGNEATKKTDRVNKAFAQGLYARIALFASGYSQRADSSTPRLSKDSDLSKDVLYPKALNALKEVIASGSASLYADYQDLWKAFNEFDLNAGKEVLYSIPFGSEPMKRGRWNYSFAVKNEGGIILGSTYSQGGTAGPVPTFFFDFAEGDVRRDLTCINWKWNKNSLQEPSNIDTWYFGKYRFEWMYSNPYTGGNDDGAKPIVMRYSDILLMASEIANELGDLSAAKDYFRPVRARACGDEAASKLLDGISSKDEMFDAIVDERAFEFCGEFLRKADLIRWNLLKTKLDETKDKMYALASLQAPYDFLSGDIYYKEADDEQSIIIWGLKPGENVKPEGNDWEPSLKYISTTKLKADKIDLIYQNDPDTKQFWPIPQTVINNSQGSLSNDYGY